MTITETTHPVAPITGTAATITGTVREGSVKKYVANSGVCWITFTIGNADRESVRICYFPETTDEDGSITALVNALTASAEVAVSVAGHIEAEVWNNAEGIRKASMRLVADPDSLVIS